MQKNVGKIAILGLLEAAVAACLIFGEWVGFKIEIFISSTERSFTLWETADRWDDIAAIIYILVGLSALFMICTCYSLYQNYKSGSKINPTGFLCPAVLSGFVMVFVVAENSKYDSDLFLTFIPFLVLIIAIAGFVIIRKMPDGSPANSESGIQQPGAAPTNPIFRALDRPAPAVRSCPVCGETCDAKAVFCSACGAKMETKCLCRGCGAELKPNMRFCSVCGAPTQADLPYTGGEDKF